MSQNKNAYVSPGRKTSNVNTGPSHIKEVKLFQTGVAYLSGRSLSSILVCQEDNPRAVLKHFYMQMKEEGLPSVQNIGHDATEMVTTFENAIDKEAELVKQKGRIEDLSANLSLVPGYNVFLTMLALPYTFASLKTTATVAELNAAKEEISKLNERISQMEARLDALQQTAPPVPAVSPAVAPAAHSPVLALSPAEVRSNWGDESTEEEEISCLQIKQNQAPAVFAQSVPKAPKNVHKKK